MDRNLCKKVLPYGGTIIPLVIPGIETGGTGLMNPSILLDNDGQLLVNLRHVNYILYHSEEGQLFQNRFGPLAYLNPENDIKLKTTNFLCILNPDDLSIKEYYKVDTSKLDNNPVWDFHGLEDARLVRWDGNLYLSGVRRDVKPNGEGRIELSNININTGKDGTKVIESSRFRIPAIKEDSYCEKNWMPIIDIPYQYVKWTNPTEVVEVNPMTKTSKSIFTSDQKFDIEGDLRGGSQVIPYKSGRIALVHEVRLFNNKLGQKDAKYFHRFVCWDPNWNISHLSSAFSFMTGEIEFACGMTFYKDDLLVTFGFQDNAAYLLRIPVDKVDSILYDN
jgi:hypothetical protein